MPGIASAATAVVIGHVAAATSSIRVGAGGIMLPNHAPLVIAEQFGTLATLFPGRIDLGLGRAPGTDPLTTRAPCAATWTGTSTRFPATSSSCSTISRRRTAASRRVQAVPGAGVDVPLWILGSSLFGAQLAAMLGLPYAFASHFAPAMLAEALAIYRERFEPSARCAGPYVMVGLNVIAADTASEARLLRTSSQQSILGLRQGRPGKLPPPVPGFEDRLSPAERQIVDQFQSCSVVGGADDIRAGVTAFVERTGADEVMIVSHVFDHDARLRSLEITAEQVIANPIGA